jgi:RNA polymerase sigma-54 factor
MRFETSQSMKMGQQMRMAPRMIQSMEILQMPLAELEERLEQELESNPTLELQEGDPQQPKSEAEQGTREDGETPLRIDERGGPESGADEFERLEHYEEANPDVVDNEYSDTNTRAERDRSDFEDLSYRKVSAESRSTGERDAKMDGLAATPNRPASLLEQLRGQWALAEVSHQVRALGELILQFLEEDGSLKTTLETIADRAPIDATLNGTPRVTQGGAVFGKAPGVGDLEHALKALQLHLEPAGIAARSPEECLTLQLDALEMDGDAMGWPVTTFANARTIVREHLPDVMQNRLPRVAEKTGLTLEQIKDALMLLKRLSIAPGRRLVETSERPIVPDAIVEFDEGGNRYYAYLNESHLPALRINEEYARLSKDKAMATRDRDFLKTNLSNAQWLLDAVAQRRHTLLRVVHKVVEHQRDFFDFGPQALKPLPMTQVGEELGIHVATVSRAVAEKFLATPRGVMPLRKFFSGGVTTRSVEGADGAPTDTEGMAWEAIKAALKDVIDAEDKKKPLSDEALAEALQQKGIDIARRTVAKYRDQLQIPAARLRRTF